MFLTIFIIVIMLAILISLGSGLIYLIKDQGRGAKSRTVKALTWRIGLSLALFLFLVLLYSQ